MISQETPFSAVETGKRLFSCSGSRFPLMKLLASLTDCLAAIVKDHAFGVQILQGDVESLEGLGYFSLVGSQ